MGLNRNTFRSFWRRFYAKFLETVTLLKRGPNQEAGTVVSKHLCRVRWGKIHTSGEILDDELTAQQFREIHIPRPELDRIGVHHISALDRFVDKEGRVWQPEATTETEIKLLEQWVSINCRSVKELVNVS